MLKKRELWEEGWKLDSHLPANESSMFFSICPSVRIAMEIIVCVCVCVKTVDSGREGSFLRLVGGVSGSRKEVAVSKGRTRGGGEDTEK